MTLLRHLHIKQRRAPLSPFMCWICHKIHLLDLIPRYGRLYSFDKDAVTLERSIGRKPEWRYMKHGWWGMYLLQDLGLFWAYIDTMQPYDENGEVDASS